MIQRYQCIPAKFTRRKALKMMAGAAAGAEYLARVKEARAFSWTPFTIAYMPDPQYVVGDQTCSGATICNKLFNWIVTNRNLVVASTNFPGGQALNIKGVIQVGDCANTTDSLTFSTQQSIITNGYSILNSASPRMFYNVNAGNHDFLNPATINRNDIGYMFREDKAGVWSPTNRAALYGTGIDLGGGDVAYWAGHYVDPTYPVSSANSAIRLNIQGMKIGVLSLEFCPRSEVMVWAKAIHDAYPDHQWWVTTHCYMTIAGVRCVHNTGTAAGLYGPQAYSLGAAPASNSGDEMWNGASGHPGMTTWENLSFVGSGHWIDGYSGGTDWVYKRLASTSTSTRAQTVQQFVCNCQQGDAVNYCASNPATPNTTSDVAHVLLMQIDPNTGTMQHFLVSANIGATGGWTGISSADTTNGAVGGRMASSAITLSNVTLASPPQRGLFPLPSPVR